MFYSEENVNLFNLQKARQTYWFKRLMDSGKGILWVPSSYFTDQDPNGKSFLAVLQGDIVIIVSDDGEGMSPDIVSKLLTNDLNNRTRGSGYGLRNINERIHLFYGPGYGLAFDSKPGIGTAVTIRIPVQKMQNV
ncbi:sensor histidine kinase [Paenibacillus sp. V4I7]|uniref:sensor histidine kinase n=1 Tax=Paenibacillus sp. V4I7 TaxID=3042307 RepID=UPI0027D79485|nr:ATP-binding protein [Paenibacillus sp. V4I7]